MAADDFLLRLERIAPGVVQSVRRESIRKSRKRPLSEQVADDVAEIAEQSEAMTMADARGGMGIERDDGIGPLPDFIPEIGKRLCAGCGRMLTVTRFHGTSKRCRLCSEP